MGLKSLARATLLQAFRDLGRARHRARCLLWFKNDTRFGQSNYSVADILGLDRRKLLALAARLAGQPGTRRLQGDTWLKDYLEGQIENGQDREEV